MNESEIRPTGRQLVTLKDRIANGFTESNWHELGMLTETHDIITGHHRLLRSLNWGDPDYEGNVIEVLKRVIGANKNNYAILLDYVARTCPEQGDSISCEDSGGNRIVFSPLVFKVPPEKPQIDLVSVMMPFDLSMRPVYEAIGRAAAEAGFRCMRADDMWEDSTVIQDVFSLIFRSYVVICDFTGRNPNVFYEAGIAHTLGKHVIPITQQADHIPADLRHHRYAEYLNNDEGRGRLQSDLTDRLGVLAQKRHLTKWE